MAAVSFYITVKPKSAKNSVTRLSEGVLVTVTASPVDGAANQAVIATLADAICVPKSRLSITAGGSGRIKRINVEGLSPDELAARLDALT